MIRLLLLSVALLLAACADRNAEQGEASEAATAPKPNILVFVADDASWKTFGAYGDTVATTPNIDGLARDGLRFDQAMLTIAQCSPSRISILSGMYPHETGAEDLHMPLPEGIRLTPSFLAEAGYFSGHMKKTHYGPNGEAQFNWYAPEFDGFPTFLDAAADKPFFMWVGFKDPHRPYHKAPVAEERHDPSSVPVPAHLVDAPGTREDIADYYDEIARMDDNIGIMLAELDKRGLADNTLVLFLSDNGMPFTGAKGSVYDAGIGTPLIARWPGAIKAGTSYPHLVSVIDLAPTFLGLAGVDVPYNMHGVSLQPVLAGSDEPYRDAAYSERNWHNCDEHIRSVRTEKYKLIRNAYTELTACTAADLGASPSHKDMLAAMERGETGPWARHFVSPRPEWELYDLEADPAEMTNLAGTADLADIEADLREKLETWLAETSGFPASTRRRNDNTDRFTGIKFDKTKLPPRPDEATASE